MKKIIAAIAQEVQVLLNNNINGHGFDHIERVRNTALDFAKKEGGNEIIIELAALLHDADDYKIFGRESATHLTNAKRILNQCDIDSEIKEAVLEIIRTMGYSNYLKGIRPSTLEGKIVSDADMCDVIGTQGILRTHAYTLSQGRPFFDPKIPPRSSVLSSEQYQAGADHAVQHFFDKLLLITDLMMTESGHNLASQRQQIMVDFLQNLFRETQAEDWQAHLNSFFKFGTSPDSTI